MSRPLDILQKVHNIGVMMIFNSDVGLTEYWPLQHFLSLFRQLKYSNNNPRNCSFLVYYLLRHEGMSKHIYHLLLWLRKRLASFLEFENTTHLIIYILYIFLKSVHLWNIPPNASNFLKFCRQPRKAIQTH